MKKITIVGLGYVGLPLAVEFGKKYSVIGYDIDFERVKEINKGIDKTLEIKETKLKEVLDKNPNNIGLFCSSDINSIKDSNCYIITVPTPVDNMNQPDLNPLLKATNLIATVIKKGDYVVYESTVYPGATEDYCVPILEQKSGLKLNSDFFVGYSPERINPGDKNKTLTKILKITSGSNHESSIKIDRLYDSIIDAGTYLAPSIKVAEAAKVIENSQRDINIAFINELAKIFNLLKIDTQEVLKAAETKWNFLKFKPGLVGGHCIGVDPYYLSSIAIKNGYNPEIILAGRRLNDSMGKYVANQTVKLMINKNINVKDSDVLILGVTFKENCPDFRNTRVIDVINEFKDYGLNPIIYDPWVDIKKVFKEYKIKCSNQCPDSQFDAIVLTVSHKEYLHLDLDKLKKKNSVVYDVKGLLGDRSDKKL